MSLDKNRLITYLTTQLTMFYPDGEQLTSALTHLMPAVLERLSYCFSNIHKKYYNDQEHTRFNHLNSDHYAMFLYVVANESWRQGFISIAEKAFLLNKALHGIDAFYAISLPEIFLFVHPVGTVLGNASYANFLVIYQQVTIGSDLAGVYPKFGLSNVLYSNCSVIGACCIGNNVSIAAHALIRNQIIPDEMLVVGLYPNSQLKPNLRDNKKDFFY